MGADAGNKMAVRPAEKEMQRIWRCGQQVERKRERVDCPGVDDNAMHGDGDDAANGKRFLLCGQHVERKMERCWALLVLSQAVEHDGDDGGPAEPEGVVSM